MDVSIIIRTKNEAESINKVLEGVFSQKTNKEFEVVVVDSGSTDNTIEIASSFNCTIIKIKPDDFSWGYALNLGIRNSGGKYIVNLSAHCEPVDSYWLDNLVEPFVQSEIAGVYGRQIPIQDVDPFEEIELALWYPADKKRLKFSGFSNANCAIRKDIWKQYPFDEHLLSCEDGEWALRVSKAGYKVVYEPSSCVFHSHPMDVNNIYLKWYWRSYSGKALIENARDGSNIYAVYSFIKFCFDDLVYFIRNGYWKYILVIPLYEVIRQYAKWRGARDQQIYGKTGRDLSWFEPRIPKFMRIWFNKIIS